MEKLPFSTLCASEIEAQSAAISEEISKQLSSTNISILPLRTVGGGMAQDLPMSGQILDTSFLEKSPTLQKLLNPLLCRTGRIFLVQSEGFQRSQIYQSAANLHFFKPRLIEISKQYSLYIEYANSDLKPHTLNILPPQALATLLEQILTKTQLTSDPNFQQVIDIFISSWKSLYAEYQQKDVGERHYQAQLNYCNTYIVPALKQAINKLPNEEKLACLSDLESITSQLTFFRPAPRRIDRKALLKAKNRKQLTLTEEQCTPTFDRPVFIVSTPRAGSTLLFETLSKFPEFWSTGEENHELLEDIAGLHPSDNNFLSNQLNESNATPVVREQLLKAFLSRLQDRDQNYYLDQPRSQSANKIRFLEKTPKNSLRIPFLKALFPDALFIYLHREAKGNISSIIDGWRSRRFISYSNLPNTQDYDWSFLLTPHWDKIKSGQIYEIAKYQWETSNQIIQQDLAGLSNNDWLRINYDDLIDQPKVVMEAIAQFADLAWDAVIRERCANKLPISRLTLSSPQRNKWLKHQHHFK